jgi:hypothetical protein
VAPHNQIVVYKSRFTWSSDEMRCGIATGFRADPTAGPVPSDTYTCSLEVDHVNSTRPRNCMESTRGWPIFPPRCFMRIGVDIRLMPLSEYKDIYWK